jgi:hypothetical protein
MSGLRLDDCAFTGPALPEPFVQFEMEKELSGLKLLPKTTGAEGHELQASWDVYRRKLRELVSQGGPVRVCNQVLAPLVERLGYDRIEDAGEVETREGKESGGLLLSASGGARLRAWVTALGEDLDAPARRGRAYRFSHVRIAQRVLLASGERVGLLTNGIELRLLISDPARPDSQVEIAIDPHWKRSREVPDSYRLLLALASPGGVRAVPDLVDKARLQQTRVTRELRQQARQAIERFIQELLDHPANRETLATFPDRAALARSLWHEGLVIVYRLLFVLHLESNDDPARAFSFASTSLWRNTFSPGVTLARHARVVLDKGADTGRLLEDGLRALFGMFSAGLQCSELHVQPLGGALFGRAAAPLVSDLQWGERAVAHLLDQLLWTAQKRGSEARQRVHYGPLDVEDLGRVYEALLELEPGIASGPMCRLRRQKLEVVVPLAQGDKYRPTPAESGVGAGSSPTPESGVTPNSSPADQEENDDDADDDQQSKKTKVEWIEAIPPGRFYLRVGLGRKSTGSYYTPHSFVRFLVQETLSPQVAERSPQDNPRPLGILGLKVLDPAMGSGHFLVEACRFLGERLYEACRLCDERALDAEQRAEQARSDGAREAALAEARDWRQRVIDLPDPDDELLRYLPSRAPEGEESGLSQKKAEALCKRLVAVHCLYGVDKNPLAVELAKLALWMESHAEGLPLTFLDHRLVVGDSLTGPFFEHLLTLPGARKPMDDLFASGLRESLTAALEQALAHVRDLEASVGVSLAEVKAKQATKERLDRALAPFRIVAAAWAGGVMLGPEHCDDLAYQQLVSVVGNTGTVPEGFDDKPSLRQMIARGLGVDDAPTDREALLALAGGARGPALPTSGAPVAQAFSPELSAPPLPIPALPYDLAFADVFYPQGLATRCGFDAVVGNPPWQGLDTSDKEFFAAFDFSILELPDDRSVRLAISVVMNKFSVQQARVHYESGIQALKNSIRRQFKHVTQAPDRGSAATLDLYQPFVERSHEVLAASGRLGLVLPSAFHANESATGLRRLLLEEASLELCFSFENLRRLFEIDSRMKFALVVASKPGPTSRFACAFYLHDDQWLFERDKGERVLQYTPEFLVHTTGDLKNFLELRSAANVALALTMYGSRATSFGLLRAACKVFPTEELHTSKQRYRTRPISELAPDFIGDPRHVATLRSLLERSVLPVCKGEHFHQFDSEWGDPPSVGTTVERMRGKEARLRAAQFYRLVFRQQASATNERTVICSVSVPGLLYFHSALPERDPGKRPSKHALVIASLVNSYPFDWLVRQLVAANVTFNFLDTVPVPPLENLSAFLDHQSVRLTCNHPAYEALWREQLGNAWRERKQPFTWPVLEGDDERWTVRAAIDAVVADAYGLSREQYVHLLSTFSHRSYPKAPELCLARFDELNAIGLEAFTRRHDPYWDIPLNENLPQPVIDLPIPDDVPATRAKATLDFEGRGDVVYAPMAERAGLLRAAEPRVPYDGDGASADDALFRRLLDLLRERQSLTSAEAQAVLGLSAAATRPLLTRLVDEDHAAKEGHGRGIRYRVRA